jgi:hypothetical protein
MPAQSSFTHLLNRICTGFGYCGSVIDGAPVHVTDFIPAQGQVSAEQFADWVFQAEGMAEALVPSHHRKAIIAAFISYMGASVVDASLLR